jgi:tetratricopeptide (TPR) repeat protein
VPIGHKISKTFTIMLTNKQHSLLLFFFILLTSSLTSNAQSNGTTTIKNKSSNIHLDVYNKARLLGDVNSMLTSLNYLIESNQTQYKNYADTLAQIYNESGAYFQCNNLCSILLKQNPDKESLLALQASSLRQLNLPGSSVELYNKLYSQTNNFRYGLELMQLQLSLQRLPECIATVNKVLAQKIDDKEKVTVPKKDNKLNQAISVKAFVLYVEALAYNAGKEKPKALSTIEKVLSIDKDFELAQQAMDFLKENKEEQKNTEVKK